VKANAISLSLIAGPDHMGYVNRKGLEQTLQNTCRLLHTTHLALLDFHVAWGRMANKERGRCALGRAMQIGGCPVLKGVPGEGPISYLISDKRQDAKAFRKGKARQGCLFVAVR